MARQPAPDYPNGATVRMGPFLWTISIGNDAHWALVGQDEAKHYGYTSNLHGLILVSRESTPALRRTIVTHELLHAAYFSNGGLYDRKLKEEAWVQRVTPMFLHALQASDPDLVAWLCERGAGA